MQARCACYLRGPTTPRISVMSLLTLKVLRKGAKNLRARIAGALAAHINIKNVGP
jgi:hypothetical protein